MAFDLELLVLVNSTTWDAARPIPLGARIRLLGYTADDQASIHQNDFDFTGPAWAERGGIRGVSWRAAEWVIEATERGTHAFQFTAREDLGAAGPGEWGTESLTLLIGVFPPLDVGIHVVADGRLLSGEPVLQGRRVLLIGHPRGDDVILYGAGWSFDGPSWIDRSTIRQIGTRNVVHWSFDADELGSHTFSFEAQEMVAGLAGGTGRATVTIAIVEQTDAAIPVSDGLPGQAAFVVRLRIEVDGGSWDPHVVIQAGRRMDVIGEAEDDQAIEDGGFEMTVRPPVPDPGTLRQEPWRYGRVVWTSYPRHAGAAVVGLRARRRGSDPEQWATAELALQFAHDFEISMSAFVASRPWRDGDLVPVGSAVSIFAEPSDGHRVRTAEWNAPGQSYVSDGTAVLRTSAARLGLHVVTVRATSWSGLVRSASISLPIGPALDADDQNDVESDAQDLSGPWVDLDRELAVDVLHSGDRIRLLYGAVAFEGTIDTLRIDASATYHALEQTPSELPDWLRQRLIGTTARLRGEVRPTGLRMDVVVDASDALDDSYDSPRTLIRRPIVEGVSIATTSFEAVAAEVDRGLAWSNDGLAYLVRPERRHHHVLVVFGRYLAREALQRFPDGQLIWQRLPMYYVRDADPTMDYEVLASWFRHFASTQTDRPEIRILDEALWRRAWSRLISDLGTERVAQIGPRNPFLLYAAPFEGALAGDKQFRVLTSPAHWLLQRPVTPTTLHAVRVYASGESDEVNAWLLHTELHIEVRTSAATTLDRLAVVLGKNGELTGIQPPLVLIAQRTADRRVFRTPPVLLHVPGGAPSRVAPGCVLREAASGDQLHVTLAGEELQQVPPVTTVPVVDSPSAAGVSLSDALQATADTWNRPVSLATMDRPIFEFYLPIDNWSIVVASGTYAAALLLRDRFVAAIEEHIDVLEQRVLPSVEGRAAYREAIRAAVVSDAHPMATIEVAGPGGTQPYSRVYESGFLRTSFGTRSQADLWVDAATEDALRECIARMRASAAHARSVENDEAKELLELTGRHFDAVIAQVRPWLVRRESYSAREGDFRWIWHRPARDRLYDVANVASQLEAAEELGWVWAEIGFAAATLGIYALPASVIRAVVGVLLTLLPLGHDVLRWYRESEEYRFALGAQVVLGSDRLRAAEVQQSSLWQVLLVLGGAGLGLRGSSAEVLEALTRASIRRATARVGHLAGLYERQGLAALSAMDEAERLDFLVALFDARAAAGRGAGLTALQRRMLSVARQLEDEVQAALRAGRLGRELGETATDLRAAVPESLRDRVPVVVDSRLGAGNRSVFLDYDLDANGLLASLRVRVGPAATRSHITEHAPTLLRMYDYTAAADGTRGLLARVRTWIERFGEPPAGTLAWELHLEIEKLPAIIVENRLLRLHHGGVGSAAAADLLADVNQLGDQLLAYRNALAVLDAHPGRGFVAAQSHAVQPLFQYRTRVAAREALDLRIAEYTTRVAALESLYQAGDYGRLYGSVFDEAWEIMQRSTTLAGTPGSLAAIAEAHQRTVDAMFRFEQLVPSAERAELLRVPGAAHVIADIARGGTSVTGADFHVRLARHVLNETGALRVLEDRMPSLPRYVDSATGVQPGRVIRAAADIIDVRGIITQAKSFSSWHGPWRTPLHSIYEQALADLLRYADQSRVCSAGTEVNGLFRYFIDERALPSVSPGWRDEAQLLEETLTRHARGVFGGVFSNPTIQVRFLDLP